MQKLKPLVSDDTPSISWRKLFQAYWFLLGEKRLQYIGLEFALFVILLYVILPYFVVGKIVDFFASYTAGQSLTPFYIYSTILAGSYVIVSFVRLSLKRLIGNYQSDIMYHIRVSGFERLLNFSLQWHYQETAGAKVQKIKSGVEALNTFCNRFHKEIMLDIATFLGVLGVFFFLRPAYTLLVLFYIICVCVIVIFFYRRIQRENDQYYLSVEQASGAFVEGLNNILTIKTLGVGEDFTQHVASKEDRTREYEYRIRELSNNMWKSFQAFNGLYYGGFLFLVGNDVILGIITSGTLVIVYGYIHNLVKNTGEIVDVYETVLNAKSGIARMMEIFWAPAVVAHGEKKFPASWNAITLSNISFAYRTGIDSAIARVSCTIPRNARIGIVGKTGSGKSTFAKLLAGLFPLSSGEYRIGDVSFYDLSQEEQSRHITLVLQETEIFNLTLEENITLMKDTSQEKLAQALQMAQLTDVVAKLSDGLNTIVGEKGYHLSGGERQRVGIARAICRDSEILIFDEATSSLDTKTEKLIQHALETQLTQKTIILVAHRISTLENVDRIYVFDEGKIVEQGAFVELASRSDSYFLELYRGKKK
ncbi:ABC transporter ATP-binding protein [Candidatus Uhrbacteria bacterium]|nr:ABC transporter ATP-binding protein [Candidatus Uhrbacteria bacterium]